MIPSAFEYHAPSSLSEAIALLQQYGDEAKVLAGGHSLIPMMKLRLAAPKHLIDIGRLSDLAYIRPSNGGAALGALTTHAMVESSSVLRELWAALPEAAGLIGDLQVRNKGTIGGSLAHADPAADYPAVVLAVEAEIDAVGPSGKRTIPVAEFFVDTLTTALQPGEIITEVRVPAPPPRSASAYVKFPHPASRYAVCGVCAVVALDDAGRCAQARVAVTGVGPKATRLPAVEQALVGQQLSEEAIASAAEKAADGLETVGDFFASAEYRQHLAKVYTRRALTAAVGRLR